MKTLRVLVIDDEPLARTRLKRMLLEIRAVEVVGECSNGNQAVEQIGKLQPDVLLLDIQMPEKNGFQVLEMIETDLPYVIFVTAYDQYAIQAFEVYALDYLLKPFNKDRLERALLRARTQLELKNQKEFSEQVVSLINELKGGSHQNKLVMKDERKIWFVPVESIDWIKAEGKYVLVHAGKEEHLMRESLVALEAKLDPKKFIRIHRSSIVNIDRIKELHPWFHGDYRILLNNGKELVLSRTYRKKFQEVIGGV
jgi:two-component system LytT family response regulator